MNSFFRTAILLLLFFSWNSASGAVRWIEHPAYPGPDVADVGESRFSQLFQSDRVIPFPFTDLVDYLETLVDNGSQNGVRQVIIPRGRSLQRDAPAPDYFRFPRVVVALEGEPVVAADKPGQVLEYRLFIAYQPKSESLEVISYNDALGRFEFEVVEDYAAGKSPLLKPANRVMCMSCHQNAAPIFASRPWSETNFNTAIARKLIESQPGQYNSLIDVVTSDVENIDVLAERANYLSAAQLIWKNGCSTTRCRAALLRAVLQYRLSGESSFDWDHDEFQQAYVGELKHNWALKWPQGLALASSRIPDRDPFESGEGNINLDPLAPRPAHARWRAVDSILARGIVYRLAGFLTLADIERIDRQLIALAAQNPDKIRRYEAVCKLNEATASSGILVCGDQVTAGKLQARFELKFRQQNPVSLRVVSLQVPGDPNIWQPRVTSLQRDKGLLRVELANAKNALSQRLANGARFSNLSLHWRKNFTADEVRLTLEISMEFDAIERALATLIADHGRESGKSLSSAAFQRSLVLGELMQALEMPPLDWPRRTRTIATKQSRSSVELGGHLALLKPYCAHCHSDKSVNPPGFLFGTDIQRRVTQCSPRILARLMAWKAESTSMHSPMPPPASLGFSGSSSGTWPQSDHYRMLVEAIDQLVAVNHAPQSKPGWNGSKYASLPPCLAAD